MFRILWHVGIRVPDGPVEHENGLCRPRLQLRVLGLKAGHAFLRRLAALYEIHSAGMGYPLRPTPVAHCVSECHGLVSGHVCVATDDACELGWLDADNPCRLPLRLVAVANCQENGFARGAAQAHEMGRNTLWLLDCANQ